MDSSALHGLGLALLGAAFLLGLRHGIDWDHIAAITDIAASQDSPRAGLRLGTLYVLGHAVVVLVLGAVAIALGATIPEGFGAFMQGVVGWTLIAFGVYVVYSLMRHRADFRLRSRWMLALSVVRRSYLAIRRVLSPVGPQTIDHEHGHTTAEAFHHPGGEDAASSSGRRTHSHQHAHRDGFVDYSSGTAAGVGALHGIGAETPTQVVIFLAAANAGGTSAGIAVLLVFVAGLVIANTAITLTSSFGFLAVGRSRKAYLALGGFTAAASLVVGIALVAGFGSVLPALFAG